jgi:hypothetical protein
MPDVDISLMCELRDKHSLKACVETGTAWGTSTLKLSEAFDEVYTIELGFDRYDRAYGEFRSAGVTNITAFWCDSVAGINAIVNDLDTPTLFWLDAHYCGEGSGGKDNECPLLGELQAIARVWGKFTSVIVIDDARMFCEDHGKDPGHNWDMWPTLAEVTAVLPLATVRRVGDSLVIEKDLGE